MLSEIDAPSAARLWLRPLCHAAPTDRAAARVGGGWAAFDAVEVLVRGDGAMQGATAPLGEMRTWARRQGRDVADRAESILERITRPRAPFAGLAMDEPRIMGVVNVTPDSFSDGGDFDDPGRAVEHGRALAAAGAHILDIGGESTRPGSDPVPEAEELRRVEPVMTGLAAAGTGAVLSVDTRKAAVMRSACGAGAAIVNDVSALSADREAAAAVADGGAAVVLMHCRGDPKTMQEAPTYGHAPTEVFDYLEERVAACEAAGITRDRIAVDPGIGFGKTVGHNLALLGALSLFHGLGCPVVLGVSRKSLIGKVAGVAEAKARVPGSLAAALWGVGQGVQIVRVHDVAETAQALAVWRAVAGTS